MVSGHFFRSKQPYKAEFDKQKQTVADIERNIDILNQFSIEKNSALAEVINPFMEGFKFEFLAFTNEGNPYEVSVTQYFSSRRRKSYD